MGPYCKLFPNFLYIQNTKLLHFLNHAVYNTYNVICNIQTESTACFYTDKVAVYSDKIKYFRLCILENENINPGIIDLHFQSDKSTKSNMKCDF